MILAQRPLCDLGSVSVADLNVMLIPDPNGFFSILTIWIWDQFTSDKACKSNPCWVCVDSILTSPLMSCDRQGLIPDPLCHHKHCSCGTKKVSRAMDLGSGIMNDDFDEWYWPTFDF
jgi:hypothetical protein